MRLHRGRAMLRREIAARSGEVLGRAFEFGAERWYQGGGAGVGQDRLSTEVWRSHAALYQGPNFSSDASFTSP